MACDYVTANIAFLLFDIMRFYTLGDSATGFHSLGKFLTYTPLVLEQIILPIVMVSIYGLSGFYNRPFHKSRLQVFFSSTATSAINTLIIYFGLLANHGTSIRITNYAILLCLFMILLSFTYIGRGIINAYTNKLIRNRKLKFNTLIVGSGRNARKLADSIRKNEYITGNNFVGFVDIDEENHQGEHQSEAQFKLKDIDSVCQNEKIDEIMLAPENNDEATILRLISILYPLNIPVKITPDTLSILTSNIRLQSIYEEPYIDISTSNASEATKNLKRLFDIVISSIAISILWLPACIIGIMIKKDSAGPIFFKQQRIGYRRKPFNIIKFRSMLTDAEADGPRLSSETDNRITRLGVVLRKYRIDELPQFWNVLKGDMSIVGPRPEREYFIKQIEFKAPYYSLVHQVRPGITSWGMVKYGYAKNVDEMVKRLRYDLIYLTNMSLTVDVKIIIYTVKTILKGRGV